MANRKSTRAPARESAATPPTTVQTPEAEQIRALRAAANWMDALSQEGFSHISAIATLAISHLEATCDIKCDVSDVIKALVVIQNKAAETENQINFEAERVGCNYVDEDKIQRIAKAAQAIGALQ